MKLVLRPEATADLQEAREWYDAQRNGLGLEFLRETDAALERARRNPRIYARTHGEVRSALLRRFPYVVYFILEDDLIVVLAVMHQRRNPATWQRRLN